MAPTAGIMSTTLRERRTPSQRLAFFAELGLLMFFFLQTRQHNSSVQAQVQATHADKLPCAPYLTSTTSLFGICYLGTEEAVVPWPAVGLCAVTHIFRLQMNDNLWLSGP